MAAILARAKGLTTLVDELGARRPGDPHLPEVREAAAALIATLETENAAVAGRLMVQEQREAKMAALAKSYDAFLVALAPQVQGAGVALRAKGDALDAGTGRRMSALSDALRALIGLYELRGEITVAADAMARTATAITPDLPSPVTSRPIWRSPSRRTVAIGDVRQRLDAETAGGAGGQFFSLGDGQDERVRSAPGGRWRRPEADQRARWNGRIARHGWPKPTGSSRRPARPARTRR